MKDFHDRYRQCFGRPIGGPTSVINQTLIGVVESALAAPEIGRVFGAIHGIQGIIDGQICDFAEEDWRFRDDRQHAVVGFVVRAVEGE